MSLRVVWDGAALARFYSVSRAVATKVDRAVIRFAERGEGELLYEPPHHLLVADDYLVLVAFDIDASVMHVLRFFKRAR